MGKSNNPRAGLTGNIYAIAVLITGFLGMVLSVEAFIAGLAAPLAIRRRKKADQAEAVNDARQTGLALFEFESVSGYGNYPNPSTARSPSLPSNPAVKSSIPRPSAGRGLPLVRQLREFLPH